MIVPGSTYWNLGIGREPGEVLNDSEGVETMITPAPIFSASDCGVLSGRSEAVR